MDITQVRRSVPFVILLALAACGSDASGAVTESKSGGDAAPTTITIVSSQGSGTPTAAPLEEFATQVEELSGGSLKADVRYDEHDGQDVPMIDDLRSGVVDMAVVPARAWSAADVDTFSALQLPFLIQSESQLVAVARDTEITDQVMGGLTPLGLTGLTMFPDGLRHLFSFDGSPILAPADMEGRTVRGPESADTAATIAALGGTFVSPSFEEFMAGKNAGSITAAESGYFGAVNEFPGDLIATGNLVLYTKMLTVAANTEFFDSLTDDQQDAIRAAAEAASEWSIANQDTEADGAAEYCKVAGSIVELTADQLEAFHAAVEPLVESAREDETMATLIDDIEALAPATVEPTFTCDPGTGNPTTLPSDGPSADEIVAEAGDLPNGTYRFELTKDFLSQYSDGDPEQNAGVVTISLRDGHWAVVMPPGSSESYSGIYQVIGDDLYWQYNVEDPPPFGRSAHLTWSLDPDGSIEWVQIEPEFKDYVFGLPWVRVGD